jgi:hypothetical protein
MAMPVDAQQSAALDALEQRFKQLDKNADGKITLNELPDSPFFKQRDKNGDGAITLSEAKAFLEAAPIPATNATPVPSRAAPATSSPGATIEKAATKPLFKTLGQAPQPLRAADHGVGRLIPDIAFEDVAGKKHKLSSFAPQRALVVAMTSTSCPLSKKYLATLTSLAGDYAQREIAWILVNPIATDRPDDVRFAADSVAGAALYVHDRQGAVARALGLLTTTDVLVLDPSRTVVFHGAIDDQYGFRFSLDQPRHRYLVDALEALLANKPPSIAATEAPGCLLVLPPAPVNPVAISYYNRISRIIQANCIECHRDGGVAPFSLATYEEVTAHAAMIKQVVEEGAMPPWFAAPAEPMKGHGTGTKFGSIWANDRSLAESDKTDLLAWIDGGLPRGHERDAPQPHRFTEEWSIGKPDAVFEFPTEVPIKATGLMPYQNVVIETNLTEDKWVQAIEVQPGNRQAVHHMLIYLQSVEKERMTLRDEAADERTGFWAIYVPGNATLIYPPGFAKLLPQNANLRCQVHYTTSGEATKDRTRIGVVYTQQSPQHEVKVMGIGNPLISIPPGAEHHREEGLQRLPYDIHILSYLPHMHLRAKACRYRLTTAAGVSRTLLDIPRYDFNWQLIYRYTEPLPAARGDTIRFTGWFDNSANNPANPDPTQTVRWGRQATDEMHLGYVEYFIPGHQPGQPLPGSGQR